MRKILLNLIFLFAITGMAQEFRISKFEENLFSLAAVTSNVKDLNGDVCALLRFSVRDDQFEIEPNLGVVQMEIKSGEIWLYVPYQTKQLTIKHPKLGVLRDYVIPVKLQQKQDYDVEIEITNEDFLRAKRKVFFNVGAGFNIMSITGPSVSLGFNFGKHLIEGGLVFGMAKAKNVSVYQTDNGAYWGTYDYNAIRYYFRYGYEIPVRKFLITPQIGAAINSISGSEVGRPTDGDLFSKTNSASVTVGCRFSLCLGKLIRIQLTPEYDVGIKKDKGLEIIQDADSKIKSWTSGFNINAGIIVHF